MTLASNSLSHRAESIAELIAESDAAQLTSIQKAMEAGRQLAEAKADCKHGEWLPFLERAGVHERKARRYMRLAESGLKSDTVSDLGGMRGALEFLAKRRLPEIGTSLIIFANESRDCFDAAYVWGSTEHPGYYYIVAYSGLDGVMTHRPIRGEPIHVPGERSVYPVWEWLHRQFGAPCEDWIFESGSDAAAQIMFEAMHLEDFEAEERAAFNMANVAGLRALIEQCQRVECADLAA